MNKKNLAKKKCIPCEDKSIKPMMPKQAKELLKEISGWELGRGAKKISKTFLFKDFIGAMDFVKKVARVAEKEGHHPDIGIFYNKVIIDLWTHSIKGLSENDFILAAKIDVVSTK